MASFNVDLNIAGIEIVYDIPEIDEVIEDASDKHIHFVKLVQQIGLGIPIGDPRNNMGALISLGSVTSILGREQLETLIVEATDALAFFEPEKPKLPSNFAIASNMNEAKQFDAQLKAATGGKV
jgi:hypothetical protein